LNGRLVLDRHRPTLGDALTRAPRWARIVLAVLAVLLVIGVLAWRLWPATEAETYVHSSEPSFNFTYGERLNMTDPDAAAGELVALEERRGDLFVQSFAVRRLELPPYEGDATAILPIVAEREIAALARRYPEFELVTEGKARVNEVPGYEIVFRARLGERRLLGRVVLLVQPSPGGGQAIALEMLGTPVSGITDARDIGNNAVLKPPFRSFRFGTERP
jgi:hypothetical protein